MSVKVNSIADLDAIKKAYQEQLGKYKHQVLVCAGAGCVSSNCFAVRDAVIDELDKLGIADETKVYETGCMGTCSVGPVILILPERIFYVNLDTENVREVLRAHLVEGKILEKYTFFDVAETAISPRSTISTFSVTRSA